MSIKNFEDIEAWKESRKLASIIYKLTGKKLFSRDFGLRDQIQRAAVSCTSNIAEGFDSGTNQQFVQFLLYSRRSSSEVQSILYIAFDRGYLSEQEFKDAYQQAKIVGKLINGFVTYLKNAKR
jgi:four helix bundle protein